MVRVFTFNRALAIVVAASAIAPATAGATPTTAQTTATATAASTCTPIWKSIPDVIIHQQEFLDHGGSAADLDAIEDAVHDVFRELTHSWVNTGADVLRTTREPFEYGDWYPGSSAEIHIGFTDDLTALTDDPQAAGAQRRAVSSLDGCERIESHVAFRAPDDSYFESPDQAWDFGTPFDHAADSYYDAETYSAAGKLWFRPLLLHEVLHAYGLGHTTTQYAFMNYPGFTGYPWLNRAPEASVRPLPNDIARLRALYPSTDDDPYYEVTLSTSWFGTAEDNGAATLRPLCAPSLGATIARFDWTTCGADGYDTGSTTVCAGDWLRTRFTVNNSSTHDVDVVWQLFLSTDEVLDGQDRPSATWSSSRFPRALSLGVYQGFRVPSVVRGVEYHPIVKIVSVGTGDAGGSVRTDWLPLRGTVTGC
jgi:hypothetical protein